MSKKVLVFLAGLLAGSLLAQTPALDAASNLMFGSYLNVAKAVAVSSTGQVLITTN